MRDVVRGFLGLYIVRVFVCHDSESLEAGKRREKGKIRVMMRETHAYKLHDKPKMLLIAAMFGV
jgi:hypothetical protein